MDRPFDETDGPLDEEGQHSACIIDLGRCLRVWYEITSAEVCPLYSVG